ncbi:MAG: energy transducer TonB [Flavobacteriaceae bacterium]|nr:energy transducer TonB [Flavobacteriaceae bacterium]
MEIKKNTKARLENYSKIFLLLGLVWAFLITYLAVEYKSEGQNDFMNQEFYGQNITDEVVIPITKPAEIVSPPPVETIIDKFDVVDDAKNIKETVLSSTDFDFNEPLLNNQNLDNITEVKIKETDEETVPFVAVEDAPTFPGCTGNKEDKKACFTAKISKHVSREFNASLAQELGLPQGKQKLFVMFSINKNGDIVNIEARAPHKSLEKEAIRVIQSLPRLIPGKQNNKAVSVKYALPIAYTIE